MGGRCSGHCCRSFYLAETPATFRARAAELLAWGTDPAGVVELLKIADMIVPVRTVGTGDPLPESDSFPTANGVGTLYTCVHFDERSGDCGSYETRPVMCSDYPYARRCSMRGCTWSEVKGPVDRHKAGKVHLHVLEAPALAPVYDAMLARIVDEGDAARAYARCSRGIHRPDAVGACADCDAVLTPAAVL